MVVHERRLGNYKNGSFQKRGICQKDELDPNYQISKSNIQESFLEKTLGFYDRKGHRNILFIRMANSIRVSKWVMREKGKFDFRCVITRHYNPFHIQEEC